MVSDYARMERIIRHLDENYREQPSLETLSEIAGWSPGHFHRRFADLVGVTPKDFVQGLTFDHARQRLREGDSVLDAALGAGLSGPGRLHDLCVTLEAASPGEIKSGGKDLVLTWGIAESLFGSCLVVHSPRGICQLSFLDTVEASDPMIASLRSDWPEALFERDDARAGSSLSTIFSRRSDPPESSPLRLWVRGTSFQHAVWKALLRIPAGSLTTYRRVAEAIGNPDAARAVGTAVGANPVALLIPCHRVIRETGAFTGYRWGVGRKRALIAWESGRSGRGN